MKRNLLALLLAVLMLLSTLPLTAFAEDEWQTLLDGYSIQYKKVPNADGSTYTITVSDPEGDGRIPDLVSLYTSMPWHGQDVTTVIFDETIVHLGTRTICLTNSSNQKLREIHFLAPSLTNDPNAVVDYSGGCFATVHAYSTWKIALDLNKFAGVSYYEAEEFDAKHTELWAVKNADAPNHIDAVLAATTDFAALPTPAQNQLVARKMKLDAMNAILNGEKPAYDDSHVLFDGDTLLCEKALNTDGVTYTVTISDPFGDGVLPIRISSEYASMPWHDYDVTTVIFDETITKLVSLTIRLTNSHKIKEIHFKAPDITTAVNAIVDYSDAPGRLATVYAYSTWTYALSTKFTGVVYYEAKNFIDEYASLWTLEPIDATFYEEQIAAAINAYTSIPLVAKEQLTEQKAKLDELSDAIGLEMPEVNEKLLFDNETVMYEKTLNEDGETYTVTVSDPLGSGALPARIATEYENMPWHDYDVTTVIFDETITSIVSQTIRLTNSHKIKEIHFKAPTVTAAVNAVVDYSNEPGRQATVYAHDTFTFTLGNKFAGLVFYETLAYRNAHQAVFALDASEAVANRTAITAAIADYMKLTTATQAQLATEKAKLDELGAALSLSGTCGDAITYLIDDQAHILQILGTGAMPDFSSTAAPWNAYKDSITKIVIGENITTVSASAFSAFTALARVDLPSTLTSIASGAFPTTAFELYGWLNHTTGQFAEANANVSLKLKEIRILSIGNSHTLNYSSYLPNIFQDLAADVDTVFTHQRIVTGGRRLISRDASAQSGNHYDAAHNLDGVANGYNYPDTDVSRYTTAFAKTWDIVIVQDYHESTQFGASFATDMATVIDWIREEAEGAKLVWFADWVENLNTNAFSYANSLAAVNAVQALDDKPDYILVVSTIVENARNTYFGTSMNPADICTEKAGTEKLPILESDGAHMSYELGQYMLSNAVMYQLLQQFRDLFPLPEDFDFFALQKTDPVHADWIGEFAPEYRAVIEEICVNSYNNRFAETASQYTVDPAIAKHEALEALLADVAVPKAATASTLNVLYKSDAVVDAINALGFLVEASDIAVNYDEQTATYTVHVDCQYGYTVSEGVTYTATLSAADASAASIGNTKYATLKAAIDAAANGDTVTLLDHVTITETLVIADKSITVNLNGNEINSTMIVFSLSDGAALAVQNGTINTYGSKSYVIFSNEAAGITVTDAALTAYDSRVIYHTANAGNVEILIKNAVLDAKNAVAIFLADKQAPDASFNALTLQNATLTGTSAIDAKRTNVTVTGNSALTATVNAAMLIGFKKTGAAGYAIALSGNEDCTVGSITITGGSFQGLIDMEPATEGYTNAATVAISGGTFDRPVPTEFCAETYLPRDNGDGTFGVYSTVAPTPPSDLPTEDASIVSYQVTKGTDGQFSLRAIAGLNSLDYKKLGYEITVTTKNANGNDVTKTFSGFTFKAYTAVKGNGVSYSIRDLFGFEYACLATITGLNVNSTYTKLDIRAYVVNTDGENVYGETVSLLYTGTTDANGFPTLTTVK